MLKNSAVVKAAPFYKIGTILLSQDFRVIGMNSYAKELLGPTASDMGKSVFHFHPKKSHSKIDSILKESGRQDHEAPIAMIIDVLKRVLMINVCRIKTFGENPELVYAMNFIDVSESTGAKLNPESGIVEINRIPIYHDHSYLFLEARQIYFIQSDGNYCQVYTEENSYYLHMTLKNILTRCTGSNFYQIHKSYIVNLEHIKEIRKEGEGKVCTVLDSSKLPCLPVARRRLADLKKALSLT